MVNTKPALQKLWRDFCSVIEYQDYERENGSTGQHEVIVMEDLPCKLSFETLQSVNQTETGAALVQKAKLFLDNAIMVKPGSRIKVSRFGKEFDFKSSGEPGIFSSHQEIILEPFEGWA
jgi:hypothetical protein